MHSSSTANTAPRPRFLSVSALAKTLHVSEVTLYRAINAGEFPAIKIRGRYVIPAKVLDAMEDAALESGTVIDAAEWVDRLSGSDRGAA
jgi:excisionase family DNA binding protein